MSTPPRLTSSLSIYHVILRGVNKQDIFEENEDFNRLLQTLRKYQPVCGYKILAYCIMSNHVHLLIKTDQMDLAQIIQRISPSFVFWYNAKYQRVGSLFQSRFKSRPVNTPEQLLTVIRYIHRNPVKAAICRDPGQYRYSSFRDYFGNDLIDSSVVLSLVSKKDFYIFHRAESDDVCMDIDEELPPCSPKDERAFEIMQDVSGCRNVTEFQALPVEQRNAALLSMVMAGVTVNQASRITGISYGVISKIAKKIR